MHRAFYRAPFVRNGKTSLRALLLACVRDDLGVDKLDKVALLDLNHHNSSENSNLGCGKSNSLSGSHRFRHIVKQTVDLGCYFFNGTASFSEDVVADLYNFKLCHIFVFPLK